MDSTSRHRWLNGSAVICLPLPEDPSQLPPTWHRVLVTGPDEVIPIQVMAAVAVFLALFLGTGSMVAVLFLREFHLLFAPLGWFGFALLGAWGCRQGLYVSSAGVRVLLPPMKWTFKWEEVSWSFGPGPRSLDWLFLCHGERRFRHGEKKRLLVPTFGQDPRGHPDARSRRYPELVSQLTRLSEAARTESILGITSGKIDG